MLPISSDVTKPNSKRKLPIGDTMSEEAKFKVKSRTASGKEKYIADPENEKRSIPEKMMACKGCERFLVTVVSTAVLENGHVGISMYRYRGNVIPRSPVSWCGEFFFHV